MIKKHIPNSITCLNLISGCIATYWALCGAWDTALTFIIIGAVFDFFDGMSARLLGVSSPIGKELDSLADDITFGLAPSAIIFDFLKTGVQHLPWHYLAYAAFIMAAFSALRLAKFNLDERQAMGFIKLGSRVDVYLPLTAKACVTMGQPTTGDQTVIAKLA